MRTDQRISKIRATFWLLVVMVGSLIYFDGDPVVLSVAEEHPPVDAPVERKGGEILLVVDSEEIRRKSTEGSRARTDWSYAWVNTLEQEVGPFSIIDRSALRRTDLTPYRAVIITHSVAGAGADTDRISHLSSYVTGGGVLLLERPGGQLRTAFAADGAAGSREPQKITRVLGLSEEGAAALKSMPLTTRYTGSSTPAKSAETLMAMDGVPVVYQNQRGRGWTVVVEFDYGAQLTTLQQGTSRDDFAVMDRPGTVAGPDTMDLVASPTMVGSDIPWADVLEKYMVHVVLGNKTPIATLWPFPEGAEGALLVSHRANMPQDSWMGRWGHEQGFTSTYFVETGHNQVDSVVSAVRSGGAPVHLYWRPAAGESPILDELGLWKIRPFAQPRTLEQQIEDLDRHLPKGTSTWAVRSARGRWSSTWTGTFRALADAEVAVDSSYSPQGDRVGYLFGTGLPFRALDTTGFMLPVTEFPVLAWDDRGLDLARLGRWLADSRDLYHEAIGLRFDPGSWRGRASLALFELWRSAYELARNRNHAIISYEKLARHWRERGEAAVVTRVRIGEVPEASLSVKPDEEKPEEIVGGANLAEEAAGSPTPSRPPLVVDVEVRAAAAGHHVSLPEKLHERSLATARWGRTAPDADLTEALVVVRRDILGVPLVLVPLRKGYNSITMTYR